MLYLNFSKLNSRCIKNILNFFYLVFIIFKSSNDSNSRRIYITLLNCVNLFCLFILNIDTFYFIFKSFENQNFGSLLSLVSSSICGIVIFTINFYKKWAENNSCFPKNMYALFEIIVQEFW